MIYHQLTLFMLALSLFQMTPRLIDAPLLEDESSVAVACGARHSVVLTGNPKCPIFHFNNVS